MCGSHQPDVDVMCPAAAQTFELLFLQYTQQFRLQRQRDIAYFIQKQAALSAISKRPILCVIAPVKPVSWRDRTCSTPRTISRQSSLQRRSKPRWMLVAAKDRTVNPDVERWYANRAHSHLAEVAGTSHSVCRIPGKSRT
jgi:hypothetical protein